MRDLAAQYSRYGYRRIRISYDAPGIRRAGAPREHPSVTDHYSDRRTIV